MPHVCRVCSHLNPDAARYCYHDGAALMGGRHDGPIAVGARPFLAPFVFPSGKACRTFDELMLACETDWDEARDMMQKGFFEGFLGGMGRGDLALAARQALREPDPNYALEVLLRALPGERRPPLLVVQPRDVNLGQIRRGEDRSFTLYLENQGMGLLSGNVRSEAPWLGLGEAPGTSSKVFQSRHDLALPVQIHGKALRAHPKPQEGRILIESSGGAFTLVVKVEVPLTPYPDGVLAGALTPRQVAEKAKTSPREAAPLFERGDVARWYDSNGWTYPVQGPAASGMAAVQQFFEALGLTRPPRVQLSQSVVSLAGAPGGNVEAFLFVESPENRPVYAHAVSETPWLHVGKARSQGNSVRLHLRVPTVPATPGEKLAGKVIVSANGGQRFPVEVTLDVHGDRGWGEMAPSPAAAPKMAVNPPPVRRDHRSGVPPLQHDAVKTMAALVLEVPPLPSGKARVIQFEEPFEPRKDREERGWAVTDVPPPPPPPMEAEITRSSGGFLRHLIPLGVIVLLLAGAVVHDLLLPGGVEAGDPPGPVLIDPRPLLALRFNDGPETKDYPLVGRTMSFGLAVLDPSSGGQIKRLMFDDLGRSNNTCVRIDDRDYLFGHNDLLFPAPGAGPEKIDTGVARWIQMRSPLGKDSTGRTRDGARSVWEVLGARDRKCKVTVTQSVEIVPGEQSARLDTCLVRYTLHNADNIPHRVGIRFLLDTFIGNNDGVPFTIPGKAGLCSTRQSFERADEVPDYIQALEKESLLAPGTVAHVQFKTSGQLESPSRVLLGGYPDAPLRELGYRQANGWFTPWEVPLVAIRELVDRKRELTKQPQRPPEPDSAVTLYWDVKTLAPDERREVGFAYGLGQVASGEGEGKLLLTVGGRTVREGEFTVTALRASPVAGEKLTLILPAGQHFDLLSPAEQAAPPVAGGSARPISTVTWRLKARRVGLFKLLVRSSAGVSQKQSVRIIPPPQGVLD